VLINTAGVLQSQASDTGSETQQEVANQIDVVHAVGEVYEGTTGTSDELNNSYVDTLNMTIKKSAGSEAIDLTSMTVQYTSNKEDVSRSRTMMAAFRAPTKKTSRHIRLRIAPTNRLPTLRNELNQKLTQV